MVPRQQENPEIAMDPLPLDEQIRRQDEDEARHSEQVARDLHDQLNGAGDLTPVDYVEYDVPDIPSFDQSDDFDRCKLSFIIPYNITINIF